MKKILLVHRNKEDNTIRQAYIADDNILVDELVEKISAYNTSNQFESITWDYIPDYLFDAVTFLINDRKIYINRLIEELVDSGRSVDSLRDNVCRGIDDLNERIEKENNEKFN